MLRHSPLSTLHSPLFVFLLTVLVGCGTSEYERRLSGRDARLKAQSAAKFNDMGDAQKLADTNVSVRGPKKMTALSEGKDDPRRIKPGDIPIPGLKQTYEGLVQDSTGGQLPFYCYVGVIPTPMQQLVAQIQTGLSAAKMNGPFNWTDLQAETP